MNAGDTIDPLLIKGHKVYPNGVALTSPEGKDFAYSLTLQVSLDYGATALKSRMGLIVPRPGSTEAEVKTDLMEMIVNEVRGMISGSVIVLFWDLRPNRTF